MKHLLLLLVMAILPAVTFAGNNYCDNRPNANEAERCYKNAADVEWNKNRYNMGYLLNAPSLSDKNKELLRADQKEWKDLVNTQCRRIACEYNSVIARNRALVKYSMDMKVATYVYKPN